MGDKLNTYALFEAGQSPWLDDISKCIIDNGRLQQQVYEEGIRGMTSNPSIFMNSISSGDCGYPEAIKNALAEGLDTEAVYEKLASSDIRGAADIMRKLYDESGGNDGFISWEESPEWAENEEKTVSEAHRLYEIVDRPNIFIKVPSTPAGIKALRRLIRDGINVNMTLMFSREQYQLAAKAYISGLEDRLKDGNPIDSVRSVASVFISRIDSQVDKALAERSDPRAAGLMGKIGLANTKLIYQDYLELFESERFRKLADSGAKAQRPLWASTGTKNPDYSPTLYVDNLIGPNTVNTLPGKTLAAFNDQGEVRTDSVLEGVDLCKSQLELLEELGVSLSEVNAKLLVDGLKAFADSYNDLIDVIKKSVEHAHEG
jgi:transaldolase/glucose-6-phosphate isomerase